MKHSTGNEWYLVVIGDRLLAIWSSFSSPSPKASDAFVKNIEVGGWHRAIVENWALEVMQQLLVLVRTWFLSLLKITLH
jgi:hypothetical protein